MSGGNGWIKGGIFGLIGLAVGALIGAGVYKSKIDELVEFRERIDMNVQQWRAQEAEQEFSIRTLQVESELSRRERLELFKRIDRMESRGGINGSH